MLYKWFPTKSTEYNSSSSVWLKSISPTEKYEYVSDFGDLDICNAIYSATPEYPNGCYHYIMTLKSNFDGTTYKEINPNYNYIDNEIPIISPEYPYLTINFKNNNLGKINNFT